MGVLALSFAYPKFGLFVGLTAGTWCYRRGVSFNPWTLLMIPWRTHGWIEVAYIIFASGIAMKIGIEMFGIRNRSDHFKHMLSTPQPILGWKQTSKPILKKVLILCLCVIMPAVVFGAFFEAYINQFDFLLVLSRLKLWASSCGRLLWRANLNLRGRVFSVFETFSGLSSPCFSRSLICDHSPIPLRSL
jgi:uncharacterized membrane protein SpoIIM required for sporulation